MDKKHFSVTFEYTSEISTNVIIEGKSREEVLEVLFKETNIGTLPDLKIIDVKEVDPDLLDAEDDSDFQESLDLPDPRHMN